MSFPTEVLPAVTLAFDDGTEELLVHDNIERPRSVRVTHADDSPDSLYQLRGETGNSHSRMLDVLTTHAQTIKSNRKVVQIILHRQGWPNTEMSINASRVPKSVEITYGNGSKCPYDVGTIPLEVYPDILQIDTENGTYYQHCPVYRGKGTLSRVTRTLRRASDKNYPGDLLEIKSYDDETKQVTLYDSGRTMSVSQAEYQKLIMKRTLQNNRALEGYQPVLVLKDKTMTERVSEDWEDGGELRTERLTGVPLDRVKALFTGYTSATPCFRALTGCWREEFDKAQRLRSTMGTST